MNKINYSQLITKYCTENQMSVKQLADKLDVGVRSVYRWRDENVRPSMALRPKLNELFGVQQIEDTSEEFVIPPEPNFNYKTICLRENYYDMLKEMSFYSNQKIRYICEQCIKFAYEHFNV